MRSARPMAFSASRRSGQFSGIVVAQESLMKLPLPRVAHGPDRLAFLPVQLFQGIALGVVHGGGQRHRRRQEGLDLVQTEVVALEPEREVEHVLVRRSRVAAMK